MSLRHTICLRPLSPKVLLAFENDDLAGRTAQQMADSEVAPKVLVLRFRFSNKS